jgi:hypothetical protein
MFAACQARAKAVVFACHIRVTRQPHKAAISGGFGLQLHNKVVGYSAASERVKS